MVHTFENLCLSGKFLPCNTTTISIPISVNLIGAEIKGSVDCCRLAILEGIE